VDSANSWMMENNEQMELIITYKSTNNLHPFRLVINFYQCSV